MFSWYCNNFWYCRPDDGGGYDQETISFPTWVQCWYLHPQCKAITLTGSPPDFRHSEVGLGNLTTIPVSRWQVTGSPPDPIELGNLTTIPVLNWNNRICIFTKEQNFHFQPPVNYDDVTTNGMVPSIHVEGDIIRSDLICLRNWFHLFFGKKSNVIQFPARSMTSWWATWEPTLTKLPRSPKFQNDTHQQVVIWTIQHDSYMRNYFQRLWDIYRMSQKSLL